MDIVDVWAYYANTVSDQGKGKLVGIGLSKEEAERAARGNSWRGADGEVRLKKALLIEGQYWVLAHKKPFNLPSEERKSLK